MKISLKNQYLNKNKIVLYQDSTVNMITTIAAGIMFIVLPLSAYLLNLPSQNNEQNYVGMIIPLGLITISLGVFFIYTSLNTFICFYPTEKKLVIREFPGLKKNEIVINSVREIVISDDENKLFSIDVICDNYTKKVYSWSYGPGSMPSIGSKRKQKQRLIEFSKECNDYLTKSN